MQKFLLAICGVLAACGSGGRFGLHKNATDDSGAPAGLAKLGCLAGVVVDGTTGARLDLTKPEALADFYVLVGDQRLSMRPLLGAGQDAARPGLVGEYTLCDVPLEANLPLFVAIPGYQPFHATILVPSTDSSQGAGADADLATGLPTLQANVRLFPLTATAQPFNVVVSAAGAALPGAQVFLAPTGSHQIAQGGDFIPADPTGYKSLKATADAGGVAAFPAADLSLGAVYNYEVIPPDSSLYHAGKGTVVVGYVQSPGEPYAYHVDLAPVDSELVVVSSSLANHDPSPDGSVSYYFNRPVELMPDTADDIHAVLDHAVGAKLADNKPGNDATEQVDVAITGQALTLKPHFVTAADKSIEPALGITYSGIKVRPAAGQKLLHTLSLAPAVKFFGGVAAASTATSLAVVRGDNQSGSAGMQLTTPLVVSLLDQYGSPVPGRQISFVVSNGGGTLSTASATTNSLGQAQTSWTLGASGTQTVAATLVGSTITTTFTAAFNSPSLITVVSGNNQMALVGTKLPTPLIVRVTDINGVNVQNVDVTFSVDDQTNGGTVAPIADTGAKTVTVKSNSLGQATVEWTLGSVMGPYQVTVASGTASSLKFNATAQMPTTLAMVSGNAQNATAGQTLTNPIVAVIRDQNAAPIAGVTLQFATATTGGTLTIGGMTAATVTGTSNASGQVSASWKMGTVGGGTSNTAVVSVPSVGAVSTITFTATAN